MNARSYLVVSALIFLIVAVLHLARIIQGWDIVINGTAVSMTVSYVGLVVAALLAFWGFRLSKGR